MTGSVRRINPLVRQESRLDPAPAIELAHENCHVPVDHSHTRFAAFQQVLDELGTLETDGLFVAVCGPSRCGKTSLINRCVDWAKQTLEKRGVSTHVVSLANVGLTPGLTADARAVMVGQRLVVEARRDQNVFHPDEYHEPDGMGDRAPVLEEYMRAVSDAVGDKSVLIVLTPRAEQATEVAQYWSGTSKRLLIFAETPETELPHIPTHSVGEANPCRLELDLLKPGDAATFARARIRVDGCRQTFPDLDLDAINAFFGDPPQVTIGTIQKFLYNVYDHYLHHPWPDGNIITTEDLERYVRGNPEGYG
jgi:hypothetical protein